MSLIFHIPWWERVILAFRPWHYSFSDPVGGPLGRRVKFGWKWWRGNRLTLWADWEVE